MTNNYVNTGLAPAQLNLSGSPYFIAISVDDTNYAADAVWNGCTSTNVLIPLGATEGWHDVWIGLRGHGDASSAGVWWYKRLKLDLTPPLLVVTNPVMVAGSATSSVPLVQIQGYSPEALSSINYDLTNATGLVTNQQVLVLDQLYSTNTWEFTTNFFQAFDVPLTNGLNVITLHATDLAGNMTTTSFNLTVDYSGKTNPPVIQIAWPNNGDQISGSNFTCRGWISDPTASIVAQCVLTNGDTNFFAGGIYTNVYSASVGRNGNFWIEGLPLSAGTNAFSVIATDVLGHTGLTNISVVQSSLILTINPVTDTSQLWKPTINLTGTISDTNQAVWVNGINASVSSSLNSDGITYTWSANNVPVNNGGTANFDITAYGPTEQQPNGRYRN